MVRASQPIDRALRAHPQRDASRDDRPAVGPFRFRPPRPRVVVRPRQFLYSSPKNTISASASGESRSRRQLTRSLLPPDRRGSRSASPVEDMAAPSRVDRLFDMLRASMRGKLFKYIERKQSSAEWRKRLPKLAERLEEILYRKFPNRNDYYNMMKGPFEPHLQFAIKTLSAQNQRLQNLKMTRDAASSSGTMISIVNHDALCQQSASLLADRSDTQNNDADEHNRTGTGFQQHQPMADMAALSGVDQQFVMLRTAKRETIFNYIGRKQSSAEWRKRLPELAKRLEEILYRKFPNKNDYYNMMKGPVEPQLQFAIKALSAQNQKNQQTPQMARDAASSSGAMIPDLNHGDVSEQPASLPADMQNNNVDKLDRTGEIL